MGIPQKCFSGRIKKDYNNFKVEIRKQELQCNGKGGLQNAKKYTNKTKNECI